MKEKREKLAKFNQISEYQLPKLLNDFENHDRMLKEMKSDLDYITKKIRFLKSKLEKQSTETVQ